MSDEAENSSAVNYLHYATSRGRTLEVMLQYPLTSRPVFLLEENSLNPKKSTKSDLTNILLQHLDKESIIVNSNPSLVPHVRSNAVVVDLMCVIRKLSSVELSNAKTFGSFCSVLLSVVVSYAKESDEIHLVMENYRHMSIKTVERIRRATKAGVTDLGVLCEVLSDEQPLPIPFNDFFKRTSNKISLQNFFVNYCVSKYKHPKPLYIAGGLTNDPDRCSITLNGKIEEAKEFRASHEEADDRMMYSIHQIYKIKKTPVPGSARYCITVVSTDADIFVVLLYHLKNTWNCLEWT